MSDREKRAAYKEYDKCYVTAVKSACRCTGWKVIQGMPYCAIGDYFFFIHSSPKQDGYGWRESLELKMKPMAHDPLLWTILDMPSNIDAPLSFRCVASFSCEGIRVDKWDGRLTGETPDTDDFKRFLQDAPAPVAKRAQEHSFSSLCLDTMCAKDGWYFLAMNYFWTTLSLALIVEGDARTAEKLLQVMKDNRWVSFSAFYEREQAALPEGQSAKSYHYPEMALHYLSGSYPQLPVANKWPGAKSMASALGVLGRKLQ